MTDARAAGHRLDPQARRSRPAGGARALGREAVARIEGFYADDDYEGADDVRFTFMKDGGREDRRGPFVIGE